MLYGYYPFYEETISKLKNIYRAHMLHGLILPEKLVRDYNISGAANNVLLKLLAAKTSERFFTNLELKKSLQIWFEES